MIDPFDGESRQVPYRDLGPAHRDVSARDQVAKSGQHLEVHDGRRTELVAEQALSRNDAVLVVVNQHCDEDAGVNDQHAQPG